MKRRTFTAFSTLSAVSAMSAMTTGALLGTGAARAAGHPEHPLTFIVAYTPGSANDILVRLIAQVLARELGQPIVVENRPGAGGMLGGSVVAKARPTATRSGSVPPPPWRSIVPCSRGSAKTPGNRLCR